MSLILPVDRLCSSYPQKLLVPIWITDKELESVASFRSWKRIPVVVYRWVLLTHCITCIDHFPFFCYLELFTNCRCYDSSLFGFTDFLTLDSRHQRNGVVIARCSQPEISWWGWRNTDDEYLVTSIAKACQMDAGAKGTCGAPACRQRGEAPDSSDSDFGKAFINILCIQIYQYTLRAESLLRMQRNFRRLLVKMTS